MGFIFANESLSHYLYAQRLCVSHLFLNIHTILHIPLKCIYFSYHSGKYTLFSLFQEKGKMSHTGNPGSHKYQDTASSLKVNF